MGSGFHPYILATEVWLYVAVALHLFLRRVMVWSMKAQMTSDLDTGALIMTKRRRGPVDCLPHQSDSDG